MTWLLAGIIPPILWALVNHTDKYLLSKAKHESSVNVLMVYSTAFSLVVLPVTLFFSYGELFVNVQQIIVQMVGGLFLTLTVYFYLMALNRDEASVVMPLALLVPVFGYVFSYVLLGEVLNSKQLLACVLIILGALVISLEFKEERKMRIKYGVLFFMILASAFQAGQETLFKFATVDNSFVVSVFWLHVGIAICGFVLIIFKKGLFKEFVESVRVNGKTMFGLNILSEGTSTLAYIVQNYATLLAPLAVIMTLNGYQPVFVFIFGTFLTIFAPKLVKEKIQLSNLLHKGSAILIILVGTILIAQTL